MNLKSFLLTGMFSLLLWVANAQNKPEDYSPFYRKGKATITLTNGETMQGMASFYILGDHVKFLKEFDDKYKVYSTKDVRTFTINDSTWYSKLTKGAEVSLSKEKTFVLLVSDTKGKVKLYERLIIETEGLVGLVLDWNEKLKRDFFVELPDNADAVFGINSLKFIPFSKKVSALLADCPTLSKKIADKEEGYAPSQLPKFGGGLKKTIQDNITSNPEYVWKKIINEYNNCSPN